MTSEILKEAQIILEEGINKYKNRRQRSPEDIALSFLIEQKTNLQDDMDVSIILFDNNLSNNEKRIIALKKINERICNIQGHIYISGSEECVTCGLIKKIK